MTARRHLSSIKRAGGERTKAKLVGKRVRIWSGERRLWWRPNCIGYTEALAAAGIYSFEDAYAATRHCGPEKRIIYEVVPECVEPYVLPAARAAIEAADAAGERG